MSIDKMYWHCGSDDFPTNMPEVNGATHIGMFLTWIINNDLLGEFHIDSTESMEYIIKIKNRELTGRDFLIDFCDGKLWDSDLNDTGRQFAKDYYPDYLFDYTDTLCDIENIYAVKDSWENYNEIEKILDERFCQWKERDVSIWDKIKMFIKK